jgi:hypothetical protein
MTCKNHRQYKPLCATIEFHLKHCPRHRSAAASQNMKLRPADKLPDPWLFDSEKLLRELDRCREMVLLIPATTHETHFACNIAVNSIWNLREQLRYLLGLHREGQRAFAQKAVGPAKSGPEKRPSLIS